jgi:hypothetical protein
MAVLNSDRREAYGFTPFRSAGDNERSFQSQQRRGRYDDEEN